MTESDIVHEDTRVVRVTPRDKAVDRWGLRLHVTSDKEEPVVVDAEITGSAGDLMSDEERQNFAASAIDTRLRGYPNDGAKLARLAAEQPHRFDTRHVSR